MMNNECCKGLSEEECCGGNMNGGCGEGGCGTGGCCDDEDACGVESGMYVENCDIVQVNQPAPMFRGMTAYLKGKSEFVKIGLDDYRGKWVVLFFYPRDFTFICPTEIKGFAKMRGEFKNMNCE